MGEIELVTLLEVWLGIIVAYLPTLPPVFSKYIGPVVSKIPRFSEKAAPQNQLKMAKHSIGTSEPRGFSRKDFSRPNKESLIKLEYSKNFRETQAVAKSPSDIDGVGEDWMSDPNAIRVQHDIQIHGEP